MCTSQTSSASQVLRGCSWMLSEAHPELPIKGIFNPITISQYASNSTFAQINFTEKKVLISFFHRNTLFLAYIYKQRFLNLNYLLMKNTFIILLALAVACIWTSCKKSTTKSTPLNITLWNKPVASLKMYVYVERGYPDFWYDTVDSTYWSITSTRIKISNPPSHGGVTLDTTYNWVFEYIGGTDSAFTLNPIGARSIIPMKIVNDTLIFSDNNHYPFLYHLIKNN